MKKVSEVRRQTCRETRDRSSGEFEFVKLWVAEMADGSRFYTSKGGTVIFGTVEKIDDSTDIADIFDFQTIEVPGSVENEDQFREIVEKLAVIDQI